MSVKGLGKLRAAERKLERAIEKKKKIAKAKAEKEALKRRVENKRKQLNKMK